MTAPANATNRQPLPDFIYKLSGGGISISFNPDPGPPTTDGPCVLHYEDGQQKLHFHPEEIHSDVVRGLGLSLTVTIKQLLDAGSTTATVLFPDVHLNKPSTIAVETILITTVHDTPMAVTIDGQRDHYSVTTLTGEATKPVAWPRSNAQS